MFLHVTYAFQSESILYSCLNVKELLSQSRREIWNLSDCNWTRAHNHLVRKQTLNHLAKLVKWLGCAVSTYLYECGFTLKRVRDMPRTYKQMHRTAKYSQHSWIIWPVWLNGWVFVYELSGCGFESSCSHLNFRFGACFEQGVSWHSGNYRFWIHYETCTWHDKNIQSNAPYRHILTTQPNHLTSLAKWLSVCLRTMWFWVQVQLQCLKFFINQVGCLISALWKKGYKFLY